MKKLTPQDYDSYLEKKALLFCNDEILTYKAEKSALYRLQTVCAISMIKSMSCLYMVRY